MTSLFHMEKCAHDLTDWKLWPRNAITHRFSLEQAGDAYALMASGKCGKVVINFRIKELADDHLYLIPRVAKAGRF